MRRAAAALRAHVAARLATADPLWAGLRVVVSDASVPGEGEHKIMSFVREERARAGHDPNTVHLLYGADADLIMLGLLTHEPHFYVLREEYVPPPAKPCDICGFRGHEVASCEGAAGAYPAELRGYAPGPAEPGLLVIELALLREHLKWELGWTPGQAQEMLERRIVEKKTEHEAKIMSVPVKLEY